jgi:hypothetical protein
LSPGASRGAKVQAGAKRVASGGGVVSEAVLVIPVRAAQAAEVGTARDTLFGGGASRR